MDDPIYEEQYKRLPRPARPPRSEPVVFAVLILMLLGIIGWLVIRSLPHAETPNVIYPDPNSTEPPKRAATQPLAEPARR